MRPDTTKQCGRCTGTGVVGFESRHPLLELEQQRGVATMTRHDDRRLLELRLGRSELTLAWAVVILASVGGLILLALIT